MHPCTIDRISIKLTIIIIIIEQPLPTLLITLIPEVDVMVVGPLGLQVADQPLSQQVPNLRHKSYLGNPSHKEICLADPGEARGCSTNTFVIN